MTVRDLLDEKARDYHLRALAAADQGDAGDAQAAVVARVYATVAIVLLELGDALDEEREAA